MPGFLQFFSPPLLRKVQVKSRNDFLNAPIRQNLHREKTPKVDVRTKMSYRKVVYKHKNKNKST